MDKNELKEAYKNYKPEMGVFAYIIKPTQKAYIGYSQNIKADTNSITFQLKLGSFYSNTNSALQADWNQYGEQNIEIKTLETLGYDKDETKTNYKDELQLLRTLCLAQFQDYELIHK